MELNNLIPDNSISWSVKKKFLMYKKYENIPVAFIQDNIVYIFLDIRIHNQVVKLVEFMVNKNIIFFFHHPELSSPKGMYDYENINIQHYLRSYASKEFYYGFKKIGFDLIKNMVKWCEHENCFELLKDNFIEVKKIVEKSYYDYFSNTYIPYYKKEIVDDFNTLYRDIQINKIL